MGNIPELELDLVEDCQDWSGALQQISAVVENTIADLPESCQVRFLNEIKQMLHGHSLFRDQPVDCVIWVPADGVEANDYNPNTVAPPEMRLLELSIQRDGYTQPVVTWLHDDAAREIIDGYHRGRVGKESADVKAQTHGYLPVTTVGENRAERGDRIASTIRHNRARGKHQVEAMSDIVVELTRRNWSEKRIGKELGMDPDEVLRLKQITGLAEMFADRDFSEAWEAVSTREDA